MAIQIPYAAAPPPAPGNTGEFVRAAWDEFYRIQYALAAIDRPAASSITASESVPVGPTEQYDRLFDEGLLYEYEEPPGQTAPATGIWTCPQEGLYQITTIVEVPAFPSPASKLYTANLRTTQIPAGGTPASIVSSVGGPDNVPLRLVSIIIRPFLKGAQLYSDLDLTHETKTGTVTVTAVRGVIRLSGYKP